MLAAMRWICAVWAMFFMIVVHAAPADAVDDAARPVTAPPTPGPDHGSLLPNIPLLTDHHLLDRIGEVGNNVQARIGEVGSSVQARIGDVGSTVQARATDLVNGALTLIGVPYRRGGTSAETGFDCSGFVRSIYQQTAGLLLPRRAEQQAAATQRIDKADLKPGDLVFFNTMRRAFSHVGIYVGNGKFIHAPKPGAEVRVEDLGVSYWARRFDGARRVPEGDAATVAPQP